MRAKADAGKKGSMSFLERIRKRWGVSAWGVVAILLAFSLAGSTVVRLRAPILGLILPEDAPTWLHWVTYILLIMPLYQTCLLVYGGVLGQFRFFWEREKKTGRWILGKILKKSQPRADLTA
jgi:hypothetical protein